MHKHTSDFVAFMCSTHTPTFIDSAKNVEGCDVATKTKINFE